MNKRELKTIYDRAKSFYKKAIIIEDDEVVMLRSYDTLILKINKKDNSIEFLTKNLNHFTQTTNRHINEFLKQFNDNSKCYSKSEILKLANI